MSEHACDVFGALRCLRGREGFEFLCVVGYVLDGAGPVVLCLLAVAAVGFVYEFGDELKRISPSASRSSRDLTDRPRPGFLGRRTALAFAPAV